MEEDEEVEPFLEFMAKDGAWYQSEIHLTSKKIYAKSFGSNDMADKNTKGI